MTYKLAMEAEKKWRIINGCKMIFKIMTGIRFVDGLEVKDNAA